MDFRKIDISHAEVIGDFFSIQPYITCDYTMLGLYMWIKYFGYEFAVEDDTLYLRENCGGKIKYLMPISKKFTVNECVEKLAAVNGNEGVVLCDVPEGSQEQLREKFDISVSVDRAWADYLYDAPALLSLSGKKYSKKRNLIHQFLNLYEYRLEEISDANKEDVIAFLEKESADAQLSQLAKYENEETIKIIRNYDKFKGLYGYALYVGDKLIGIEICECINDVCFIHIEKADRDYKGAHQFIFWRAINEIYKKQSFKYINREEDVGDQGLRQAKESYYPIRLLTKYDVEINYENR